MSPAKFFPALCLALFSAATLRASTLKISADSAVRVGATEVEGNYTTTHFFVDEVAGDVIPVTVFFDPQAVNIQTCEIFTNLNRRDRAQLDADGDGIDDGIKPPPGNGFVAGDDGNYYKIYTMQNLHDVNPALSAKFYKVRVVP